MIRESDTINALAGDKWNREDIAYIRFHAPRFAFLLNLVGRCLEQLRASEEKPALYLDVGPHFLTRLVDEFFGKSVRVNKMGWSNPRLYDNTRIGEHYQFDLNDAYDRQRWPLPVEHDVVLLAEVVEHLYTAPEQVLEFLRGFVRPGGLLIVQTPNGAALRNRALLAVGRNPFERIRPERDNPGHYREYTLAELREIVLRICGVLFPSLRRGLTLVLRRDLEEVSPVAWDLPASHGR
ncbi:hypothetical protein BH24GEM2_BH24GEM2_04270 [soil metagenome]